MIKDGKTSHETQRESGDRYAAAMDWSIVGHFEDLDVSASISPWERPDLGPWLNERSNEWDALIFAKVDRAFRSIKDCADVAHWAEQNKKILVFADDGIVCNFREDDEFSQGSMIAKLFLMMSSMFAEMELKRFYARNRDVRKFLNVRDRWPGGKVPYGFKPIPHPEGGKTLTIDPETSEIVKEMGRLFLAGRSTQEIAETFTAAKYPTPTQHMLTNSTSPNRDREVTSTWNKTSVSQMLRSPAIMGYKVLGKHKDQRLARDPEGMPIRLCDPIFSEEEWDQIKGEIARRGNSPERRMNASPLLGIVYCGSCGHRLYRNLNVVKGHTYVYYRCPAMPGKPACPAHGFREEYVANVVNAAVELDMSDIPVTRKVFVPGESHTAELNVVIEAMSGYMDQFDAGTFNFNGGQEMFRERMSLLATRRTELEALPQRADAWTEEPTGETYAEAYRRLPDDERRLLLITAGISIHFEPLGFHIRIPDNLAEKAREFRMSELP